MSRGCNNKNGTSGQGASNQSNQGFITGAEKKPKSNHRKHDDVTGGKPSEPQQVTEDQDSNRDHSTEGQERKYN